MAERERESNTTSDYTHSEERGAKWEGQVETLRPQTADRDDTSDHTDHGDTDLTQRYNEERPYTTARRSTLQQKDQREHFETRGCGRNKFSPSDLTRPDSIPESSSSSPTLTGSVVELCLAESWGDPGFIGLTGLELLQADTMKPIRLRSDQLSENPPEDGRGIEVLVDGVNLTTDVKNMYLCPCTKMTSPGHVTIMLILDTPTRLYGMRLWNYNASMEDSYKGVS